MVSNISPTDVLLIFIKNPIKGRVKTRLAAAVGDEQALRIYRALLERTRQVALAVDAERWLFYSHAIKKDDDWPEGLFRKFGQEGDDLGARMENAFAAALKEYPKAVLIGSDIASLTPEIVGEAFRRLDEFPFVVGPAIDGGYYLLGMTAPAPSLFHDMTWSTAEVLSETLRRIRLLEKEYFLLPELSDIDRVEDWEKYGWEV